MALMHPKNLNPVLFTTKSEYTFYEQLEKQLSDKYHVFYSVTWNMPEPDGNKRVGECDFLIYNPEFGFLIIEVKGGTKIEINDGWWTIYDRGRYRELRRSPFKQAQDSMYFFKEYFEKTYNVHYSGVFGSAVGFPYYNIESTIDSDAPEDIIISLKDMEHLNKKINSIFHYWSGKNKYRIGMPLNQQEDFLKLVNKKISIKAAFERILTQQTKEMDLFSKIQDSYWDFLNHYKRAFIIGSAGTGKTFMAIKRAFLLDSEGLEVLLLCFNKHLSKFLQHELSNTSVVVKTFHSCVKELIGDKEYFSLAADNIELSGVIDYIDFDNINKYDAVIIDEGQDFTYEWAEIVSAFLKDEMLSYLYVFYDEDQNIFKRNFKNTFNIQNPPFVLSHNLRNTENIWNWIIENTQIGGQISTSGIYGMTPEIKNFKTKSKVISYIQMIVNEFTETEGLPVDSIVILSDVRLENSILNNVNTIAGYTITNKYTWNKKDIEISFHTLSSFKGLESDVVIFLNHGFANNMQRFVAYSRARFFLYELNCIKLK